MRKFAILAVFIAGTAPACAYDTFLPMGMGYSTSNAQLSQLSPADRRIISQTDIYETEIYQRQLEQQQLDARMRSYSGDRNSDFTSANPNF